MIYRLNSIIYKDNSGNQTILPVLFDNKLPIIPVVEYLIEKQHRSNSWKIKVLQSLKLLFEYMEKNWNQFETPQELFCEFSIKLFTGTVGDNGEDPSGLRWYPRRVETANCIISNITNYSEWLFDNKKYKVDELNQWRRADTHEERIMWAAYHHRKNNSFLSHLDHYKKHHTHARKVPYRNIVHVDCEPALAFPEDKFIELIREGFVKNKRKKSTIDSLDLRNILITLLMHWGGLRLSECFHIWISDILPDPKDADIAVVRVYHPQYGSVPCNIGEKRESYLRKIGMLPRNLYCQNHSLRAGWKNPVLENRKEKYFYVYWADEHARIFMKFWRLYRDFQRIDGKRGNFPFHPFAFTNKNGDPYGYKKYVNSHKRAVEKIGLIPAKNNGTTPHSHRHAVGIRLAKAKIDKVILKKVLHHRSISSQETYTIPSNSEIYVRMNNLYIDTSQIDDLFANNTKRNGCIDG